MWKEKDEIELLKVELKRLKDILDEIVDKKNFSWYPGLCPVCDKAEDIMKLRGAENCEICKSLGVSDRCTTIDLKYCNCDFGKNYKLNDEDVASFVSLFNEYIIQAKEELVQLKQD